MDEHPINHPIKFRDYGINLWAIQATQMTDGTYITIWECLAKEDPEAWPAPVFSGEWKLGTAIPCLTSSEQDELARRLTEDRMVGDYHLGWTERVHQMTDDRPAREIDEIKVTPAEAEEFWSLFVKWKDSWPTSEQLEVGGTGDLDSLMGPILNWARVVLERDPKASQEATIATPQDTRAEY